MSTVARPVVFSDVLPIPNVRYRNAILVVGFALLTAAMAQIRIPLGFTPVPVTGQTFAVLLAGAALGWRAGALSQLLYLVLGLFLPFYADGNSGWDIVSGATGGYLVGMVVAAALVGKLAERAEDRTFLTAVPAMLMGSAIIYVFGIPWLAHELNVSSSVAIEKGLAPFVIGDGLKVLAAGALLPTAWRFVERSRS